MTVIRFDEAGITSCPMNETATREECTECYYSINSVIKINDQPVRIPVMCRYKDEFPEEKEE